MDNDKPQLPHRLFLTKMLPKRHPMEPSVSQTILDEEAGTIKWVINIDTPIFSPNFFALPLHILLTAKKDDVVHILLETPGGSGPTCTAMCNAMDRCKAHVITEVVGTAYSSGAYMWAHGNELRMGKFAQVMFHTSSHGDMGRTRDIKERAEAIEAGTAALLDRVIAKGIITPEERDAALEDKRDVFYTYEDLKDRIGGTAA